MFGLKNKIKTKLKELEDRIVALATKVEENNHDIGELKGEIKEKDPFQIRAIELRIEELERRQQALRKALVPLQSQAIRTDPAVDDDRD